MSGLAAALMMEIGQGSYTLLKKKKKKKKLSVKLPLDCIFCISTRCSRHKPCKTKQATLLIS
jgi:hypothetical protein